MPATMEEPSWTCTRIEMRITPLRKTNSEADGDAPNQDLPLPGCMKLPVIWRM